MPTGKAVAKVGAASVPVAVAVIAALPAEAVIVLTGSAAAITVIGACWMFGKKIEWNLGPWNFKVGKD